MIFLQTTKTGPFAIGGAYRVALAIHDALNERTSLHEACHFIGDLLLSLLKADAISLELPKGLDEHSLFLPASSFGEGMLRLAFEQVVPIKIESETVGYVRLFFREAPTLDPSDAGLLDFAVGCIARKVAEAHEKSDRLSALTPAERRVLDLLPLPTAQILEALCISHETYRSHTKRIYKKLGVKGRNDAVQMAKGVKRHLV